MCSLSSSVGMFVEDSSIGFSNTKVITIGWRIVDITVWILAAGGIPLKSVFSEAMYVERGWELETVIMALRSLMKVTKSGIFFHRGVANTAHDRRFSRLQYCCIVFGVRWTMGSK